ncbi:hypothetical protein [Paramagnetospirillum magneticum]|uniref:Uncharacterized protein n=1 Tax=Paramagnetospirillum magneticum (strain ATCC 700264 / AMB-1) TaxID=342108 RepID=Q2WAN7_PARM1|nr:hypothetical protein [Paramagnetospirillum magneticum]BAE49088.1 hypothetical protein amb0284 [Paramagnetospirillum magneticum AMB-1]
MDHPVEKPATTEEQEALFQAIILKMPGVTNPAKLEQLTLLALDLMLRRPFDKELRAALRRRVQESMAEVKPGHTPEVQRNEMRIAARGCIEVLRAAKEQRLPRSVTDNWAQSKDGKFHPPHHRVTEEEQEEGRGLRIAAAALVALTLAIGGYIWWSRSQEPAESTSSETDRFVAQMVESAQGNAPPSHLFGGAIRVTSMNGVPVVIAERVPPRICSASGMKLVKKGLLSVNGVTPTRVSSAIITELCNKDGGGDATLMWAPK